MILYTLYEERERWYSVWGEMILYVRRDDTLCEERWYSMWGEMILYVRRDDTLSVGNMQKLCEVFIVAINLLAPAEDQPAPDIIERCSTSHYLRTARTENSLHSWSYPPLRWYQSQLYWNSMAALIGRPPDTWHILAPPLARSRC